MTDEEAAELRADLDMLLAASSNFFIAREHLTLPETYQYREVLRNITNALIDKYKTP